MSEEIVLFRQPSGEYVATTPTFPSLSWIEASAHDAAEGMKRLIAEVLADIEDEEE